MTQLLMLCKGGAGGNRFELVPGQRYLWRGGALPATLTAYMKSGVLERLDGDPKVAIALGLPVTELTAAAFADPPPEPAPPTSLSVAEVLKRQGWTVETLRLARAQQNFPRPDVLKGGATAENPDAPQEPRWFPGTIERWERARREFDGASRGN